MRIVVRVSIAWIVLVTAAGAADRPSGDTTLSSPQQVEQKVLEELSAGRQGEAERLLKGYMSRESDLRRMVAVLERSGSEASKLFGAKPDYYRGAQRVLFLQASCIRSRFDREEAFPIFHAVYAIDRTTPSGKGALYVMQLDSTQYRRGAENQVAEAFARFGQLADANPNDVVLRWMLGVECRTWNQNVEGVKHYQKILQAWNPGPVLVHQTYANLLDELHRYEEALVERHQAVTMEPAGWSYDGLGNTLRYLRRFSEANKAHAKAIELDPDNFSHWTNWGVTLCDEGKYDEAIAKCERAVELNPRSWRPWWCWGNCLEAQGKKAEALEKYRQILTFEPESIEVRARIARLEGLAAIWRGFWEVVFQYGL